MTRKPPIRTDFRFDLRPSEIFEQVYEWNPRWYVSDKDGSPIAERGDLVAAEPEKYPIHAVNMAGAIRISGWLKDDIARDFLDILNKKADEILPQIKQSNKAWQTRGIYDWEYEDGRTKTEVIEMLKWAEGELEKYLKYLEENDDDR